MYFLSGAAANLQTLLVLARPHLIQGEPLSESLVARAYRNYLADLQPQVQALDADRTVLVRDDSQASLLAELFDLPAVDRHSQRGTATSMDDSKAAFFTAGLERIAEYDSQLASIFQTAVVSVFSTQDSATPGSTLVDHKAARCCRPVATRVMCLPVTRANGPPRQRLLEVPQPQPSHLNRAGLFLAVPDPDRRPGPRTTCPHRSTPRAHESHASAASAANSHACDRQLRGFDAHFTRTGTAPRCLA
ncbi:hypothetical protein GCM10010430_41980 [Kitasatospora cystarginea]|uniref:Uncharacterized protein n=1 Tax=Kitasatospora cystarginea TaxID=58350 RepID=A0ABN3EBK2_9ACTN